jgi:hypothetical protein
MNDEFQDGDYPLLALNDPASDGWEEESMLGRLMEEGLFDAASYAELERAIVETASAAPRHFESLGVVARIVERITLVARRHVDPQDAFRIENLDDEEVAELDRRVRHLLLEMSLGNEPDMSRWD